MNRVLDPEGAHLAALRRLGDFRGRRIIELGCGDGRLTVGLATDAAGLLAFDPDAEAVANARRSLPSELAAVVDYQVAPGTEIEVEPASFDIAVFSWSLCCVKPDEVVDVLRNMIDAVKPGGIILDLQVIRSNPRVEVDGGFVCEIDGEPLFMMADAAAAAIDAAVAGGRLVQQATDDHDVLKHYPNGADLVHDFAPSKRRLPDEAVPRLRAATQPCVVRERCRLRRLSRSAEA